MDDPTVITLLLVVLVGLMAFALTVVLPAIIESTHINWGGWKDVEPCEYRIRECGSFYCPEVLQGNRRGDTRWHTTLPKFPFPEIEQQAWQYGIRERYRDRADAEAQIKNRPANDCMGTATRKVGGPIY